MAQNNSQRPVGGPHSAPSPTSSSSLFRIHQAPQPQRTNRTEKFDEEDIAALEYLLTSTTTTGGVHHLEAQHQQGGRGEQIGGVRQASSSPVPVGPSLAGRQSNVASYHSNGNNHYHNDDSSDDDHHDSPSGSPQMSSRRKKSESMDPNHIITQAVGGMDAFDSIHPDGDEFEVVPQDPVLRERLTKKELGHVLQKMEERARLEDAIDTVSKIQQRGVPEKERQKRVARRMNLIETAADDYVIMQNLKKKGSPEMTKLQSPERFERLLKDMEA